MVAEPAFRCAGCGAATGAVASPFRCTAASPGDDVDHVVVPVPPADSTWPVRLSAGGLDHPFVRYRSLLSAWRLALSHGLTDDDYRELVQDLDAAIARVDGRGFAATPFRREDALASRLGFEAGGELWVKDETGNVSGSHKARHLAGVMLYLLVAERGGIGPRRQVEGGGRGADREQAKTEGGRHKAGGRGAEGWSGRAPLAIASCGNAALAAAVVARAAEWPLIVFVPPSASPFVLARLDALGARVTTCRRQPGVAGDPCYLAFKRALEDGAIPFCCQGSDNGLTIEGGQTIAWEMVDGLAAGLHPSTALAVPAREARPVHGDRASASRHRGIVGAGLRAGPSLDAVFVQAGGGALASAVFQGFDAARRLGSVDGVPRLYTVQTEGGHPLARAYERVLTRTARRLPPPALAEQAMLYARTHRSEFMWPWEEEPRSVAHGILDDETYDWAAVVEGMLRTGGRPVVVGERSLEEANVLARSCTSIDVDHTGSAGLAGLMDLLEAEPSLRRARVAVIFSGVRRRVTS